MHEAGYDRAALLGSRIAQLAFDRGVLLTLSILVVYLWVAPEHIVFGDNAELSSLGALGGAAHPSGYPLYVMWLRAWSWLPAASPAHAAAMATAILAALQALVLHAACRAWGARPFAATLAVGVFAAGPIALRIHSEAEVFALNGLVVAAVLWLAAATGPARGLTRIAVLGLVAGLGLSNHLTCVLVTPIGVLGVLRGVRESRRSVPFSVVVALAGLGVGLLPYLYLLVTPATWVSWGSIDSLGALVRHFTRADYGPPGQFSPRGVDVDVDVNLLSLARSTARTYLWILPVVGGAALGYFAAVRDRFESRVAWSVLATSWLLAGPLLASRFNIRPAGIGLYVVQRFHLLSLLILAVPIAVGLDRLVGKRLAGLSQRFWGSVLVRGLLTVGGFLGLVSLSLPELARGHSRAIEQGLVNMLRTLPPDSIVIGATDEFHFGMGYLQGVLGERADVAIIVPPQLGLAFYRERVRRRAGISVDRPEANEKLSVQVAERALATGRPVFIDPYQANIATSFPTYPYGLVFRVLPRGSTPPPITEVLAENRTLYARYVLDYPIPGPDDQLATQFHIHYARAWRIIGDALARSGRRDDEAFARQMAEALAPR